MALESDTIDEINIPTITCPLNEEQFLLMKQEINPLEDRLVLDCTLMHVNLFIL